MNSQPTNLGSERSRMSYLAIKRLVKCLALILIVLSVSLVLILREALDNRIRIVYKESSAKATILKLARPISTTNRVQSVVGSSQETLINQLQWTKCQWNSGLRKISQIKGGLWTQMGTEEVYIHSAFWDDRGRANGTHAFVRIMAYLRGNVADNPHLQCYFPEWRVSIQAHVQETWLSTWDQDPDGQTFRSFLVNCRVPQGVSELESVSLSTRPCDEMATFKVHRNRVLPKRKTFCLCVKPLLFKKKDMSKELIEWIEANRLFGAEKIVFYLYEVHRNVNRVLDYYVHLGVVQVIQWSLPQELNLLNGRDLVVLFHRKPWQKRRSEVLPYNHCFYQNFNEFEYVLPIDIDEFIFPVVGESWHEVLEEHFQDHPDEKYLTGSFSVRNAYFFRSWNPKANLNEDLVIEAFTERSANLSRPGFSVKSFMNTNVVVTLFNHYALSTLLPTQKLTAHLNPDLIRMNHYKESCPSDFGRQCEENFWKYSSNDTVIKRFVPSIKARIKKVQIRWK